MSILINKKFDVLSEFVDGMYDDISSSHPSHLSIIADGVKMEFDDDVSVELNNGFMRVSGDDDVSVIRYKDISSYHISHLSSSTAGDEMDDADVDELWRELYDAPSSLPSHLLSLTSPVWERVWIIMDFMMEYNGLSRWDEIYDDEWYKETFNDYMRCKSYKSLNDCFSSYLWDFMYTPDDLKELCDDGWSMDDFKWINDVISYYSPVFKECDDDE